MRLARKRRGDAQLLSQYLHATNCYKLSERWKSVLDVDALRAKATSPLAAVWLHGKLLYALMLERRMRRQLGDSWGRLDHERMGTWWRV